MAEYIEREVTCADCIHYDICIFHHTGNENEKCVHFKNKDDVVEVRHGEWSQNEYISQTCTACGFVIDDDVSFEMYSGDCYRKPKFCPECGAKMDGKGEGE